MELGRDRGRIEGAGTGPKLAAVPQDAPRAGLEPTLANLAWMIFEGRWTVLAGAAIAVALGVVYLLLAAPTYSATAVVQVEQKRRTVAGLDDLSAALGESPPAEPEMEIIRSRVLLGSVVEKLQLELVATPRTFPIVGRALARRHKGPELASAPPLLSSFAWGGERIRVQRLDVPEDLLDLPLTLVLTAPDRYRLVHEGATLLEGEVGKPAAAGEGDAAVTMLVTELVGRPGTQFRVTRRDREHVIDALLLNLRVQEKGKRSGILVLDFWGRDPKRVAAVANEIATAYLRQNVERRSAEAAKTLTFLESQLPTVKATVDQAEAALNAYKVRSGSVDTAAEARGMVDRATQLEKEIADAEVRRSELRQAFTDQHPNLVAVANKLAVLRSEHASLSARMRSAPRAELESNRLARELKDATDLYVSLLNKSQELRVAKFGTVGDVRIIDNAHVPDVPSSPKPPLVVMLTLMLGLTGGVGTVVLRRTLMTRAEGPDEIEAATGLPVYATIPHSEDQARLLRARRGRGGPQPLLAEVAPGDVAIEAMRSLRTSLQFALVESQNNVVVLAGPAPGVGKSFVATNLAHVLAATGKRVLIVDCDLRRGRLHRQFGLTRTPGVSEVVSGVVPLDQAIRKTHVPQLELLATGRIAPNPAELLASQHFETLLAEASKRFDLVLVDTPPILAVTDAMLVARFAGVNFLVVRSGMHTGREIAHAVKQYGLNSVKLHGSVLNDVLATRSGYARDGYVRYEYTSDASE